MNTMTINGHKAVITYDPDTDTLRGEFIGLNSGADFCAKDIDTLRKEGETSLRVYLDMCKEQGLTPCRQYSGRFNVRISPQLHAAAVAAAAAQHISLNEWINNAIQDAAHA
jgi:possible pilus related protein hicB